MSRLLLGDLGTPSGDRQYFNHSLGGLFLCSAYFCPPVQFADLRQSEGLVKSDNREKMNQEYTEKFSWVTR